jgi:hypothetical protein
MPLVPCPVYDSFSDVCLGDRVAGDVGWPDFWGRDLWRNVWLQFSDPAADITESRKKGIGILASFHINTLKVYRFSILQIKTTLVETIPSVTSLHALTVIIYVCIVLY